LDGIQMSVWFGWFEKHNPTLIVSISDFPF
jgi:hypothetical protein